MKGRPAPLPDLPEIHLRWVAVALAAAILPHVLNLPVWIPLLALAMIAWGWWGLRRRRQPGRLLRLGLVGIATLGVLAEFHTLFGRDAGVALLVLMLGLKILELKGRRDALLALFLAYFVVAGQFFFTQSIPIALAMLLSVLLITGALIGLAGTARPLPARRRLGIAGSLLAQSIPMMLLLFVLFPRLPGPLWAMPRDSTAGLTGLSDQMSPGRISDLIQSNAPAFRATFEGPPPPASQRYWRGPVLDHYDGRSWQRALRLGETTQVAFAEDAGIDYSVTLQPSGQRWLLALDYPGQVPPGAELTPALELVAPRPQHEVRQYRMRSYPDAALDLELSAWSRARHLRLPEESAPRARELAQEWLLEHDDPAAIVEQALDHFREQPFHYTLRPPLLTGDPVDAFLFGSRRGFCEHYASSFTVLMRAAGIPARVVTGYLGGEISPLADYLLVRQSDAHAWSEVWLEGRGWVRVDPTAAIAPERIEQGVSAALGEDSGLPAFVRASYGASWLNRVSMSWDIVNYYWDEWVLAFGPERQRELLERLGLHRLGWTAIALILMAGLAALLGLYVLVYRWRNRPRFTDEVERLQHRLERLLARQGFLRRPGETVTALALRAAKQRPAWQETLPKLVEQLQRARYREDPLDRGGAETLLRELQAKRNPPEAG
ncbi:MAG: DUF3488 and transglutaminase-like domain-containing protein [Gammaproteobacteria bacterium]|nr:DUF3488 and transglutaminase-like domain-containing protein [Gammaproteobacteria bacterium]